MHPTLDPTCQRIVGVLIEKELSVPDSYPLTLNALVAGCNQQSNREPAMSFETFQIEGALWSLHEREFVARVDGNGRVTKYRHRMRERFSLDEHALAVMAELLLRGPQAPGALKPRVQRMGFVAEPEAILQVLESMAQRGLVSQLPLGPRERDRRWQHGFGDGAAVSEEGLRPAVRAEGAATAAEASSGQSLEARVAELERVVAQLRAEVEELKRGGSAG